MKYDIKQIKEWIDERYINGYSVKAIDKTAHSRFSQEKLTHKQIHNIINNQSQRNTESRADAMKYYHVHKQQKVRNDALFYAANRELTDREYWATYDDEMGY